MSQVIKIKRSEDNRYNLQGLTPKEIIERVTDEKCFVIGGGKTFSKFTDHLTHLYITPHPLIFGQGVKLFESLGKEIKLKFGEDILMSNEMVSFSTPLMIKEELFIPN